SRPLPLNREPDAERRKKSSHAERGNKGVISLAENPLSLLPALPCLPCNALLRVWPRAEPRPDTPPSPGSTAPGSDPRQPSSQVQGPLISGPSGLRRFRRRVRGPCRLPPVL